MSNSGRWYTVQTLSGQEMKAKGRIESRMEIENMQDYIHEIFVPIEKLVEKKQGKTITINKKLYPGYMFINIDLFNEAGKIREDLWYFIKNTNGIINFLGGDEPVVVDIGDIEYMKNQVEGKNDEAKPKAVYELNDKVIIKDGEFESFEGSVTGFDAERGKLQLSVMIFGRATPVELEYWQVEKVENN